MSLAPNLLRRGANYSWRRRVPTPVIFALEHFPQDYPDSRSHFRNLRHLSHKRFSEDKAAFIARLRADRSSATFGHIPKYGK